MWDFACLLRCPYCCISPKFCFLLIVALLIFAFSVLILVAVISLPLHFFYVVSCWIDASMLSWILVESSLSFFSWHTFCLRHLYDLRHRQKFSCSLVNFFVLSSSTSRMVPNILQGKPTCFFLLRFLLYILVSSSFFKSFSALFYVVFESMYRYVYAIFNANMSSSSSFFFFFDT